MTIARAMRNIYSDIHPAEGLVTVDAAGPGDWPDDLPDLPGDADAAFSAPVERGCREATFLAVDEKGRNRRFRLFNPLGREYTGADGLPGKIRRVRRPAAGCWKLLPGKAARKSKQSGKPSRPLEYLVSVRSDTLRLFFTTPRTHYALEEAVNLAVQVSAGPTLLGYECTGIVTDPAGEEARLKFSNDPDGGLYTARFTARREGQHLVRCVVRGREGRVRAAPGADSDFGPKRPGPPVRVPDFTRTSLLTVRIGGPIDPEPPAPRLSLEPGERAKVSLDLGGRTWVPAVSRLTLGPGIDVMERPAKSIQHGRPRFVLTVRRDAVPGLRDGIVRTGVDGFSLPGLVTIVGEAPEPLDIDGERVRYPGRHLRRLLEQRREDG